MPLNCTTPVNTNICTKTELNALAQLVADIRDEVCAMHPDSCIWAVTELADQPIPNTTTECNKVIAVSENSYIDENTASRKNTAIIGSNQVSMRDTGGVVGWNSSIISSYGFNTTDAATYIDGARVSSMIASWNSHMDATTAVGGIVSSAIIASTGSVMETSSNLSVIDSAIIGSINCITNSASHTLIGASDEVKILDGANESAIIACTSLDFGAGVNYIQTGGDNNLITSTTNANFISVTALDVSGARNFVGSSFFAGGTISGNGNAVIGFDGGFQYSLNLSGDFNFFGGAALISGSATISGNRNAFIAAQFTPTGTIGGGNNAVIAAGSISYTSGVSSNAAIAVRGNINMVQAQTTLLTGSDNSITGSSSNYGNVVHGVSNNGTSGFFKSAFLHGTGNTYVAGNAATNGENTGIIAAANSSVDFQLASISNGIGWSDDCTLVANNTSTAFDSNVIFGSFACDITDANNGANDMMNNMIIASDTCTITGGFANIIGASFNSNITTATNSTILSSTWSSITSGAEYSFIAAVHALDAVDDANRLVVSGDYCFAIGSTVTDSLGSSTGSVVTISGIASGCLGDKFDATVNISGDHVASISNAYVFNLGFDINVTGENVTLMSNQFWGAAAMTIGGTRSVIMSTSFQNGVNLTGGGNHCAIIASSNPSAWGTFYVTQISAVECNVGGAQNSVVTGYRNNFTGDSSNKYNFVGGANNVATTKFIRQTIVFGSALTVTGAGSPVLNSAFLGHDNCSVNTVGAFTNSGYIHSTGVSYTSVAAANRLSVIASSSATIQSGVPTNVFIGATVSTDIQDTANIEQCAIIGSNGATINAGSLYNVQNSAIVGSVVCQITDVGVGGLGTINACGIFASGNSIVSGVGTAIIGCNWVTTNQAQFNAFIAINNVSTAWSPNTARNEAAYVGNLHIVRPPASDGDVDFVLCRSETAADDGQVKLMSISNVFKNAKLDSGVFGTTYANDAAAATGGVPVGYIYIRTTGELAVRLT